MENRDALSEIMDLGLSSYGASTEIHRAILRAAADRRIDLIDDLLGSPALGRLTDGNAMSLLRGTCSFKRHLKHWESARDLFADRLKSDGKDVSRIMHGLLDK